MDCHRGEFDMISAGFGVGGTIDSYLPQSPFTSVLTSSPANVYKYSPVPVAGSFLPAYEITHFEPDQSSDSIAMVHNEEVISNVVEEVISADVLTNQSNSTNLLIQVAACDLCGVPLASLPATGAPGVFCKECVRKGTMTRETNYTDGEQEDKDRLTCELCAQYFPDSLQLLKHKETHIQLNGNSSFLCKVCFLCFRTNSQLMDHMKMHEEVEKPFACKMCPQTFASASECAKHATSTHIVPSEIKTSVICSLCNVEFVNEVELKHHFERQHEEMDEGDSMLDPLSGFCVGFGDEKEESSGKTSKSKSSISDKKQQFKYQCDFCAEPFPNLKKLNSHRRCHTGEKPYVCPICCKAFRENIYLKRHMYLHTKAKDHVCEYCGKGFQFNNHLVEHKRIHTGERPYKCEFCDMRFTQTSVLMRHQVVHTGERLHNCHICSRSFSRPNQLEVHLRIHSGEKPFQCKFCYKQFNQSGQLTRHTRRHQLGEMPPVKTTLLPSDVIQTPNLDGAPPSWDFYLPQVVLVDSPPDNALVDIVSL